MIYLIVQIFLYLVIAGLAGGAAGWLLRNLQSQRSEEHAHRAVHDARAKVPQLESLLRGRDEQVTKLKGQVKEFKQELAGRDKVLKETEQKLREQTREAQRWQQSAESARNKPLDEFDLDGDQDDADELIAQLSREITELKAELERIQVPSQNGNGAGRGHSDDSVLSAEMDALKLQLSQTERELTRANADLRREQERSGELERERELQNKSLHVLHQQLDLERTRRTANGG